MIVNAKLCSTFYSLLFRESVCQFEPSQVAQPNNCLSLSLALRPLVAKVAIRRRPTQLFVTTLLTRVVDCSLVLQLTTWPATINRPCESTTRPSSSTRGGHSLFNYSLFVHEPIHSYFVHFKTYNLLFNLTLKTVHKCSDFYLLRYAQVL